MVVSGMPRKILTLKNLKNEFQKVQTKRLI